MARQQVLSLPHLFTPLNFTAALKSDVFLLEVLELGFLILNHF